MGRPHQFRAFGRIFPGEFAADSGTFTITGTPGASALIVTPELCETLASECVSSGRYFVLTQFVTEFPVSDDENDKFVFVIDCSGSIQGQRIAQTRKCLAIFISSLPPNSPFNIVRFGSNFEALFPGTVAYAAESSRRALAIAERLAANLGGTNIYQLLRYLLGFF
jgi:Ca-activated chloride channel family protein